MHVCMYVHKVQYIHRQRWCTLLASLDVHMRTHTHSYKYTLTYTFPWPHGYHPWLFGGSFCFNAAGLNLRRAGLADQGRDLWNGSKPPGFPYGWVMNIELYRLCGYTTTIYFGVRDSHVGFFDNRYFLNSQFLNIVRNYLFYYYCQCCMICRHACQADVGKESDLFLQIWISPVLHISAFCCSTFCVEVWLGSSFFSIWLVSTCINPSGLGSRFGILFSRQKKTLNQLEFQEPRTATIRVRSEKAKAPRAAPGDSPGSPKARQMGRRLPSFGGMRF